MKSDTLNPASLVDEIIKKWFPAIGILFITGGISYLFYDGIWQKINEVGRLTFGFIVGISFLLGGHSFQKQLSRFADAMISGGILILYITLIYGSRFQANSSAIISELWALLIAVIFFLGIVFYSYQRQSKYILLMGMFGGYLTPFFIGESGDAMRFWKTQVPFYYQLPLSAFLIYFAAINSAILVVAHRLFLPAIGLLNSLGLFLGTVSLAYLMGGAMGDQSLALAGFAVLVIILHVSAMIVNTHRFSSENDPYLVAGYLLPVFWLFLLNEAIISQNIGHFGQALLYALVATFYFSAWYALKRISHTERHYALYLGGILALACSFLQLKPALHEFDSVLLAIISAIFGIIYIRSPLLQRQIAFLTFALAAVALTSMRVATLYHFPSLSPISGITLFLTASFSPLLLAFLFPDYEHENVILSSFCRVLANFATVIILLLWASDLFRFFIDRIPKDFMFLTIPAIVLTVFASIAKTEEKQWLYSLFALIVASLGFSYRFLTILDDLYRLPINIHPLATPEAWSGIVTVVLFFILLRLRRKSDLATSLSGQSQVLLFYLIFATYLVLWSVLSHEVLATFNILPLDLHDVKIAGIRSFAISAVWALLASVLILLGLRDEAYRYEKNIGFCLLAGTIIKIIFADLVSVNTNLKVFLFILVGLMILGVSYVANRNEQQELEHSE